MCVNVFDCDYHSLSCRVWRKKCAKEMLRKVSCAELCEHSSGRGAWSGDDGSNFRRQPRCDVR